MAKYKNFDCTIWEDGTIILTERLLPKKGVDIEIREGKTFKGTLKELAANPKKLFLEE